MLPSLISNVMLLSWFMRGATVAHRVRRQQVDADRSILLTAENRAEVVHGNAQRVLQL